MSIESERRVMFPGFYKTVAEIKKGAPLTSTGDGHLDALLWSARMGFSNRQLIISFTKWMHGFNVTDVDVDFASLQGELEEAVDAYKNGTIDDTAFELADICNLLLRHCTNAWCQFRGVYQPEDADQSRA